ncbi:MAG: hypothetical protein Hals2KO_35730 [Halioglobus sp.]
MNNYAKLVLPALLTASMTAVAAPEAGDRSFSISGTGASDKNFDGNSFGVSFDVGKYATEHLLWGVRQSINGVAGEEVNDAWNGSTRLFADYHFGDSDFRPYVGANLGGLYGESTNETFTAGLETGFRYYVKDKTFIGFGAEYQFLFDEGDEIDSSFNDGAFFYTLGVGFNF